jgi:glycosyltransferase involved in cell wall biosynthesis
VGREGQIDSGNSIKKKVLDILKSAGVLERCCMIEDCTDTRPVLAASDIYVQPSHQEGLSVALGEALACALPTVVTSVGGNPEMVFNSENGFVVPPADPEKMESAIRILIKNKKMRQDMGNHSFLFAKEKLHPSVILDAYSHLYDQM